MAPPGGVRRGELDGLLVVGELDLVKGKSDGGDRFLGEGGQGRERRCESPVIEGGALCLGLGINEYEAMPTLHRLAVPEPAGLADPGRAFGDVHDQALEAIIEAVRTHVVGERALGDRREGRPDGDEDQDQSEAMGYATSAHGSDSFVGRSCDVWIRPTPAPAAGAPTGSAP